jgi:hypothetical protein
MNGSHSPADADLMVTAERELGVFIRAVTELFGPEQARLAAEDWVDALELMDACLDRPGVTGDRSPSLPRPSLAQYRRGPSNATRCVH